MIYKNGIKSYILLGVYVGSIYGVFMGLFGRSALKGLWCGVFFAMLFGPLMYLIATILEKKFVKKRAQIQAERKLYCDGSATLMGNGGWMYLTENGLEFYPHKINYSTKEYFVALSDIESARVVRKALVVTVKNAGDFSFVVANAVAWKKEIEEVKISSGD